jgi:glutathione synthase/RimK-type ligase-like ATP-grasp enzyme
MFILIKEQIDKLEDEVREIRKTQMMLDTLRVMSIKGKDRIIHDIEQEEQRLETAQRIVEWLENTPEDQIPIEDRGELAIARNTVQSSLETLEGLKFELKQLEEQETVVKNEPEEVVESTDELANNHLEELLSGKKEQKKVPQYVYLEQPIVELLDKYGKKKGRSGKKSELINEILKEFFEQRGDL